MHCHHHHRHHLSIACVQYWLFTHSVRRNVPVYYTGRNATMFLVLYNHYARREGAMSVAFVRPSVRPSVRLSRT